MNVFSRNKTLTAHNDIHDGGKYAYAVLHRNDSTQKLPGCPRRF